MPPRSDNSLTQGERQRALASVSAFFTGRGNAPSSIRELYAQLYAEGGHDTVTLTGLARALQTEPGYEVERNGTVRRTA